MHSVSEHRDCDCSPRREAHLVVRLASTVLIGALLACSSGCYRSSAEVQNATAAPVTDVEIRVAGNELSIDRIDAGQSRRVAYVTRTEETMTVSFRMQGVNGQCSSASYVSPPFEDAFTIRIAPGGRCSISRKSVAAGL